jgi:RNA polymerase sigma-54 factor
MAIELRQVQKLTQQLVMTPQLQQAIKLLQLSRLELEELISQELAENPVLEEAEGEPPAAQREEDEPPGPTVEETAPADPARETSTFDKIGTLDWQEYLDSHSNSIHGSLTASAAVGDEEAPPWESRLASKPSLKDHLMWQLRLSRFTVAEQAIGAYIIGNLDEKGYLAASAEEICLACAATPEEVESVVKRVQLFDPVGVGARDLRECLITQLEAVDLGASLACSLVRDHLADLETRRYEKIARALAVSVDEIVDAVHLIASLQPKPAHGFEEVEAQTIIPDVYVEKIAGEYVIHLNEEGLPRLRISSLYRRFANTESAEEAEAKQYLQEKVRSAAWLIKSIQQRQQTLYRVTKSIFQFQRDFLEQGIGHLKPMVLRDVANDIGMHESTVSRATSNKYVHTPRGVFELKFFFQSGLKAGDGVDVAAESVREKIRGIIAAEDPRHPYSDQYIAALLGREAIDIARRTVAKYREAMGILPSSRRRHPYAGR